MRLVRTLSFGLLATLPCAASCFSTSLTCEEANTCDCPSPDNCPGGGGTGGTGGSVDPGCVPSSLPANTPLPATCTGMFVSGTTGNDTAGDGTRGAPYASLAKALESQPLVVYACAGQTTDAATVTLPAATSLFGGLDCADWHYTGDKTALTPGTTTALVLAQGAGARVEDFHIESATATVAGASSIAVLSNAATAASLTRVELVAGDGADGGAGVSLPPDSALDGLPGGPGTDAPAGACNGQGETGGPGGQKTCGGVVVDGGNGGGAFTDPGGTGFEGQQPTVGASGDGGIGQQILPVAQAHSCGSQQAQSGADGTPGPDGTPATGAGALSATGYSGPDGTPGTPGLPGQGGGGGGASACTGGNTGPSGGGGGSGACGGAAGGAGKAAGASIALLAFGGELTVSDATLTTGAGGVGGAGGNGQPGGLGGTPGLTPGFPAPSSACIGAAGGNGGPGGSGGGGLGGPSIGVASSSAAVVTLTNATSTIGAAGAGGPGGDGKAALDGAPGERCAGLDFDTVSCAAP